MKSLILIFSFLHFSNAFSKSLKISGHIIGYTNVNSIEINTPTDGNYWPKNSIYIKPGFNGYFSFKGEYSTSKCFIIKYKASKIWVLISPSRPLKIEIHEKQNSIEFLGTAKLENDIIQKLKLNCLDSFSFIKQLSMKNSYISWSIDSICKYELPKIATLYKSSENLVSSSNIPLEIKKMIKTDLKYDYAIALCDYLGNQLQFRKDNYNYFSKYLPDILSKYSLPTNSELQYSFSANGYLDAYMKAIIFRSFYNFKKEKDTVIANRHFKNSLGISYQSLLKDPDIANEKYLFGTRIKILPRYAQERHLLNLMTEFCMTSQLEPAKKLLRYFVINYPKSKYIGDITKMFNDLLSKRDRMVTEIDIKIRENYKLLNSIDDIIAPYKGKTIFIDIWGTWCPHCIEDIDLEGGLYNQLHGKGVEFLYIDVDNDTDDIKWKNFIYINDVKGDHIRKTYSQMSTLWGQLGIRQKDQSYPHYLIVDKNGIVKIKNAERPGKDEKLLKQIKEFIE